MKKFLIFINEPIVVIIIVVIFVILFAYYQNKKVRKCPRCDSTDTQYDSLYYTCNDCGFSGWKWNKKGV